MSNYKKIKILYIQVFAGGGSLNALYEIIKNLDINLIEPSVICYHENENSKKIELLNGCKVFYPFKNKIFTPEYKAKRLSKFFHRLESEFFFLKKFFIYDRKEVQIIYELLKKIKPNIIHHNNGLYENRSSVRAASKTPAKQIIHTRGVSKYQRNNINFFIDSFFKKKISAWIFLTADIKDYYKNTFHLKEQKLHVFNDLIDTNIYRKTGLNKKLLCEFNIEERDFVIVNAGRIIEWKGQHILIEAINLIKMELKHFKVLLVGSNENGIGSAKYYNSLKDLIFRYQLQHKILLTGNRNDVADVINISNVVVHTAIKPEPQGLIIIEAMLCEKPVVATNAGGAAQLINKYGGILVTTGDAEELSKVLLEMYKKHENNEFNIDVRYNELREDFNSKNQILKMVNIYKNLVS